MKRSQKSVLAVFFLSTSVAGFSATVTVGVTNVLRSLYKPVGINLDFLVDNDETYPRAAAVHDVLNELGAGTLRFPMGELADRYLFEYDSANQQDVSCCSIQGSISPFKWTSYVDQSDGTFPDAMTTSNYLDLVQETGAVPFFCVGIDAILKDRSYGQTARSEIDGFWQSYTAAAKSQVYEAASNWVSYVQSLGVEGAYWEIGNENYLDSSDVGGWIPEKYAEVVSNMAAIIHGVDPTARVGCNGGTYYQSDWWDRVLPIVEDSIDFMVVHEYFGVSQKEYTNYIHTTSSLTPDYDLAKNKRDTVVSTNNRYRIKFCITETSSHIAGGDNTQPNNLGKALMNFDLVGQFLQKNPVSYLHFWITRYLNNDIFTSGDWTGLYKDSCALDDDNSLLPMGQVLQLWTAFSYDQLLQTSDDSDSLVAYASSRSSDEALTVWILNRDTSGEDVQVVLDGFEGNPLNMRWLFDGTDPDDTAPTFASRAAVTLSNNTFSVWAMPNSISIIEFAPDFGEGLRYNLINAKSGALLELDNPSVDGGNAHIWEDRGNWSKQEWVFEEDANGYYEIINQADSGAYKRLEVADPQNSDFNVIGWQDRGNWARQKWSVEYDSQGWFSLENLATGKALETFSGGITNGTNVEVGNVTGWEKQRWLIVPAP